MSHCQFQRDGNVVKCPNCNQPSWPPVDASGNLRWALPDDPKRWPIRDCNNAIPQTPPAKIILAYLSTGAKETTDIIRDLSNSPNGGKGSICTKTLNATLLELKAEGKILLSEDCQSYSLA